MEHWGALLLVIISKITHLASSAGRGAPGTVAGSRSRSGDAMTVARPQVRLPSLALDAQLSLDHLKTGSLSTSSDLVVGLTSMASLLGTAVHTIMHRSIGTREETGRTNDGISRGGHALAAIIAWRLSFSRNASDATKWAIIMPRIMSNTRWSSSTSHHALNMSPPSSLIASALSSNSSITAVVMASLWRKLPSSQMLARESSGLSKGSSLPSGSPPR